MYRKYSLLFVIALLSFAAFSCSCEQTQEDTNSDEDGINITIEDDNGETQTVNIDIDEDDLNGLQNGIADALQEASNALRDGENGESVEIVGFRELKELMPARLLGMDRSSHSGEKTGAMGFTISQAEAEYEDGDQSLKVQIVDAGQFGMMKAGLVAWASVEIDKESDDGYERTFELDGHKAFEKWDARSGDAELVLFYLNRFIVTLNGDGLDGDDLRKALRRIDYEDLD